MDLVATPGNAVPDGLKAASITASDGVRLRVATAMPRLAARGTVCIFPGRAEFIERYFETISDLLARGFAVAILDWRGQGASQRLLRNPRAGHVRSFSQYDRDLAAFMQKLVLPDCPPPFYALAHSTGGLILMRCLVRRNWFERAVLSAPLFALAPRGIPAPVIRIGVRLAVMLALSRVRVVGEKRWPWKPSDFENNPVTSDRARFLRDVQTLQAAPHLGIGAPTYGWVHAALKAMRRLRRMPRAGRPRAPVLILAAGDDRLVSTNAIRRFAERVPGVSALVIPDAKHELLNERDEIREQFFAAFDSFVSAADDQTGASASRRNAAR